jgi:hypothetical protein
MDLLAARGRKIRYYIFCPLVHSVTSPKPEKDVPNSSNDPTLRPTSGSLGLPCHSNVVHYQ